jgi:hypothetical protein
MSKAMQDNRTNTLRVAGIAAVLLLALISYVVGYFALGTLGQVGPGNTDPPFVWRLYNSRTLAILYVPAAKVESLLTNKRIQTTSPNP